MKKHFLQYFLTLEYAVAALVTVGLVFFFLQLTDVLADYNVQDATSPLNPIASRIDFINIEDISLDAIFAIKDLREKDRRIAIVNVGAVAPTPDNEIAALLHKLRLYGARVVGIDVLFDSLHFERFEDGGAMEIANLQSGLEAMPATVLARTYRDDPPKPDVRPVPALLGAARHLGHVNLERDQDEVVRRFYPYRMVRGERWPSMAVAMATLYDSSLVAPLQADARETLIVHYRGTWRQFPSWDLATVLETDDLGPQFKDRLVLVGYVNEGGIAYLDDTHKTPLGKKTERAGEIGVEGPDMSGILIHANILNMLLTGEYITPVPAWMDWSIAFVLTYLSIVLYRILRTKAVSKAGLAALITVTLLSESLIVFFIPIIAFFQFELKISYNIMATAVLLFIPAGATVSKLRFLALHTRLKRPLNRAPLPVAKTILRSFEDSDPFPAVTRLVYSAEQLIAYAWSVGRAATPPGDDLPRVDVPGIEEWRAQVPELGALLARQDARGRAERHFLHFLHGKKDQLLRDSSMKDLFFGTQLTNYNEHFFTEEWEILLPHILRLFSRTLREYLDQHLVAVAPGGDGGVTFTDPASGRITESPAGFGESVAAQPGVLLLRGEAPPLPLSPWCEVAECKLHRRDELFVFAGLLAKQHGLAPLPAYFGDTVCCEPVLPPWTLERLQAHFPRLAVSR
jgi:CHASE2 domain-containing sensor protein